MATERKSRAKKTLRGGRATTEGTSLCDEQNSTLGDERPAIHSTRCSYSAARLREGRITGTQSTLGLFVVSRRLNFLAGSFFTG